MEEKFTTALLSLHQQNMAHLAQVMLCRTALKMISSQTVKYSVCQMHSVQHTVQWYQIPFILKSSTVSK